MSAPIDPARHLLAERWNQRLPVEPEPADGSTPPVDLDARVAGWRASIAEQADREPVAHVSRPLVRISHARCEVIEALLHELAKRTRPGLVVGPVRSDGSLARLARELSEDIWQRAF